ncbi:hypothetical protein [Longispora urticae]
MTDPKNAPDREVQLPDPEIYVSAPLGRLRLALETAGFRQHTNRYGELYSIRDGVRIRLAVDDELDLMLYPLQPGTPPVPSEICPWRASFGPGCPDELIIAVVNFAAAEDLRLLAAAEQKLTNRTA